MTESMVRFGAFTDEGLQQSNADADALGGGIYESIEVGDNFYRFLPPPVGKNTPFRVTALHYVEKDDDSVYVFACPAKEMKQPCPVCLEAARLAREPNAQARERSKRLQPAMRVFANVINRDKPDAGVRVLSFGKQIYDQLKSIRANPRKGGDFSHPIEGFDIIISRTGTGKNDTRYSVTPARGTTPLAESVDAMQMLIDTQHDLEQQVDPVVPEELTAAYEQAGLQLRGREVKQTERVGAKLMSGGSEAKNAVQDAEFEEDDDSFLDQ